MIRHLLIACSIVVSASAFAAPNWIQVEATDTSTILLDRSSVVRVGEFQSVGVLRIHDRLMNLGNDPETQEALYPHRSVKLRYFVDCRNGKAAVEGWQMYTGTFGDGEVVWAGSKSSELAFTTPWTDEEASAVETACSSLGRSLASSSN